MLAALKVKLKSLAAEARIIKYEERKKIFAARKDELKIKIALNPGAVQRKVESAKKPTLAARLLNKKPVPVQYHEEMRARAAKARDGFHSLRNHRLEKVRKECRHSHLAYGFLRDVPYRRMEQSCHTEPDWKAVQSLIERFAEGDLRDHRQRFSSWKEAS